MSEKKRTVSFAFDNDNIRDSRYKKAVSKIEEITKNNPTYNKITSIVTPEPKSVDPDNLNKDISNGNNGFENRKFFDNQDDDDDDDEVEVVIVDGDEEYEETTSSRKLSAEDILRMNSEYPDAINRSLPQFITQTEIDAMNNTFFKCKLCHLMFGNADVDELNKYVRLGRESMNTYGIFPLDINNVRDTDAAVGEESYKFVLETTDISYKKAFIWIALFTCRSFITVFCPPINSHLQYSCDPNHLYAFVEDSKSTFPEIVARYIIGNYSTHLFNALCTAEWFEKSPWSDMDQFKNLHPSDVSLESQLLSGYLNKTDNSKAQLALSLTNDYYHTTRDELGSQKRITQAAKASSAIVVFDNTQKRKKNKK